ncbi:MAG TPA: protealysin inhibitor emfourin [Polyangiaceae bacterium]
MRVRVTHQGGFTGQASAPLEVDVDSLPEAPQRRLRELVDRDVWPAPAVQRSPHPRPQDFEYTVTVDDGARQKSVKLHKSATSAGMRELIAYVEEHGH